MKIYRKSKHGIVIVVVLMLSSVFLISSLALFQSSRNHRHFATIARRDLQAHFIALSALQHAELKIRFFPSELYDGAALSIGKNPYFDFTELSADEYSNLSDLRREQYRNVAPHIHLAGSFNRGPRFISQGSLMAASHADHWFRLASVASEDSDSANFIHLSASWFPDGGWPRDVNGDHIANSDLYLWRFRSDISSNNTIQPALGWAVGQVRSDKSLDIATDPDGYPFQAMYELQDMRVISIVGNRRLGEEAIVVTGLGTIIDPDTNEAVSQQVEKIFRVRRN